MMDYEYHDYEDEYTPLDGSGNSDRRKLRKKKESSSSSSKRVHRRPPPSDTTYRGKNYGPPQKTRGCCAWLCRCCSCWLVVVLLCMLWATWLTLWLLSTYLLGPTPGSPSHGAAVGAGQGNGQGSGVGGGMALTRIPTEVANEKGAFCLDGTTPAYYHRKGSGIGSNSWILHLPDGQWCYNVTSCYQRSLTSMGSSHGIPSSIAASGLLSQDASVNPDFHDWNVVQFHYCDGASFSSEVTYPVSVSDDHVIYLRGARIFETILMYLLNTTELKAASRIIFSGSGSGGLGVFYHADRARSLLPANTTMHALVDSAFYPDSYNRSNYMHIRLQFQRLFNFHHLTGSFDGDCVRAKESTDPGSVWQCMFPEYAARFIQTPLFIATSLYNPWSMWFILDMRCHPLDCPELSPLMERFGTDTLTKLRAAELPNVDGVFVTSCYADDLIGRGWDHVTISTSKVTPKDAFGAWYLRRSTEAYYGSSSNDDGNATVSSVSMANDYWFMDCSTSALCNGECDWSKATFQHIAATLQGMEDFFIGSANVVNTSSPPTQ